MSEWSAAIENKESGYEVFIQSEDFKHDVRLYVNGDFTNGGEAYKYAKKLADKLNNKIMSQRECYQRGHAAGRRGGLKDHEIATLVNDLTLITQEYAGTEQLREHISKCVVGAVKNE